MKKSSLVAASLVAVPLGALGQDTGGLEEILVTAQRREQNLQEVPISVSAFSGEQLQRSNIRGAADYLAMTPNVSFTEDAQSGSRGLGVAIRGVNNLVSGENAFVNSVGNYLDEFSIASVPNGVANPMLIDMERVEVLRGPQGTYFGRNSLGGALNLTTRAPTDEYEGEVALGMESYEDAGEMYNVTGIFNAPLSDAFKVRAVAFYEDSGGLVENIGPGTSDSGHEWLDLRLRAVWELSDATSLGFTVIYSDQDQGTDENVPSGIVDLDTIDTFGFQPGIGFDPGTGFWPDNQNKLSHDLDESNELETTIAIANLRHEISDSLTFKAVAGLIDASQTRLFDNDLIGNLDVLKRTNDYEGDSWSVEARLESESESVDWVIGALYAEDQQEQFNDVAVSSDPTATFNGGRFPAAVPRGPRARAQHQELRGRKPRGVRGCDLARHRQPRPDRRRPLHAGRRAERADLVRHRAVVRLRPARSGLLPELRQLPAPPASGDTSFDDVSPRAGIRYAWSDAASVYATVSKGYKAGGTSTGNNTNAEGSPTFNVPYDEETLWNYEVGIKTEFADRRVRLNASVFFMDWEDLQVEAFRFLTPGDLSSNFEQTVNVDAEGQGAEIELLAAATDNLTLGGSIGYLDTEITDEPPCDSTRPWEPASRSPADST